MTDWKVRRRAAGSRARGGKRAPREFVIEDSLGYLVNRAARVMAQQLAQELKSSGVAIGQWAKLMHLWAGDGLTQAELSRVVAIEPPTMVRTIDRMVRDGLVERRPDPKDRRVSRIYLTAQGSALRGKLIPKAAEVNQRILERMTADERDTLVRLLAQIGRPSDSESS